MIKLIVHSIILFILCGPVSANVSRIYKDHFFNGNIRPIEKVDRLRLFREDIKAVFPLMHLDDASLGKTVDMHIAYIIENGSGSTVEIPVQFLGIDIHEPQILLNNRPLLHSSERERGAEKNFLAKITEHRYQWNKSQYDQYFMHLDFINSGKNNKEPFPDSDEPAGIYKNRSER